MMQHEGHVTMCFMVTFKRREDIHRFVALHFETGVQRFLPYRGQFAVLEGLPVRPQGTA